MSVAAKLDVTVSNTDFVIGGRYNWKNQPERLIYLGYNLIGKDYWHQFAEEDVPGIVWCEVLTEDLHMLEKTQDAPPVILAISVQNGRLCGASKREGMSALRDGIYELVLKG